MKKFIYLFAFVAMLAVAPKSALAVGESCGASNSPSEVDDLTQDNGAVQTCVTNASGMSYTFKAMGVCDGFPNYTTGLDNCIAVFDREVEVDFTGGFNNNTEDLTANIPPAGDYDYMFAIAGNSLKVTGSLDFNGNNYLGIDGDGDAIIATWCRPNGTFNTSVVNTVPTDLTDTSNLTALQGIVDNLPIECFASGSPSDGTATININNVGLGSNFSALLNIDGYTWDNGVEETHDINVVLLDSNANVATSAGNVQDVLFIKNRTANNLTIADQANQTFDVRFTTYEGLQLFYMCDSNIDSALVKQALGVSGTITDGCAILGLTLGEGALTPNITME